MAIRTVKIYFFLFLYGVIFSALAAAPQFYSVLMKYKIFEPASRSVYSSFFMTDTFIIILLSCALTSLFAVLSWRWLGKIHPLSFIFAYIILVVLTGCYLIFTNDVAFMSFWMTDYITLAPLPMAAACWVGKQVYDIKDRNIGMFWGEAKALPLSIFFRAFLIFLLSAFLYLTITLLPLYMASKYTGEENTFSMNSMMSLPGLWMPLFPLFLVSCYFISAIMRKNYITMVHFSRIALTVTFVLIFIMMISVAIDKGLLSSDYIAILLIMLLSNMFILSCQISVLLSLSFWLMMKWFKLKIS